MRMTSDDHAHASLAGGTSGVLARVAQLFSPARVQHQFRFAVSGDRHPEISRITIVSTGVETVKPASAPSSPNSTRWSVTSSSTTGKLLKILETGVGAAVQRELPAGQGARPTARPARYVCRLCRCSGRASSTSRRTTHDRSQPGTPSARCAVCATAVRDQGNGVQSGLVADRAVFTARSPRHLLALCKYTEG